MKPRLIVVSMLVAVLGVAAVFVTPHWQGQRSQPNPALVVAVPQVPTKTIVVADGTRAMSISISDVHGVTGFVLPGDHVDIMLTRSSYTDSFLHNIKVLAIDHLADERADKPKSGRTATVEVNSIDAQKLTLAQAVGTLSIALRAAGSVEAAAPRRITMKDLGPAFENYSEAHDGEGEEETAVDLLAKNMEESLQAIETRINQLGQEFRRTRPIKTEAIPFDPNAQLESRSLSVKCAAATPRHPFAGRHPCFPE